MTDTTNEAAKQKLNSLSEQQIIDDILKNMPSNDEVEVELPSYNRCKPTSPNGQALFNYEVAGNFLRG